MSDSGKIVELINFATNVGYGLDISSNGSNVLDNAIAISRISGSSDSEYEELVLTNPFDITGNWDGTVRVINAFDDLASFTIRYQLRVTVSDENGDAIAGAEFHGVNEDNASRGFSITTSNSGIAVGGTLTLMEATDMDTNQETFTTDDYSLYLAGGYDWVYDPDTLSGINLYETDIGSLSPNGILITLERDLISKTILEAQELIDDSVILIDVLGSDSHASPNIDISGSLDDITDLYDAWKYFFIENDGFLELGTSAPPLTTENGDTSLIIYMLEGQLEYNPTAGMSNVYSTTALIVRENVTFTFASGVIEPLSGEYRHPMSFYPSLNNEIRHKTYTVRGIGDTGGIITVSGFTVDGSNVTSEVIMATGENSGFVVQESQTISNITAYRADSDFISYDDVVINGDEAPQYITPDWNIHEPIQGLTVNQINAFASTRDTGVYEYSITTSSNVHTLTIGGSGAWSVADLCIVMQHYIYATPAGQNRGFDATRIEDTVEGDTFTVDVLTATNWNLTIEDTARLIDFRGNIYFNTVTNDSSATHQITAFDAGSGDTPVISPVFQTPSQPDIDVDVDEIAQACYDLIVGERSDNADEHTVTDVYELLEETRGSSFVAGTDTIRQIRMATSANATSLTEIRGTAFNSSTDSLSTIADEISDIQGNNFNSGTDNLEDIRNDIRDIRGPGSQWDDDRDSIADISAYVRAIQGDNFSQAANSLNSITATLVATNQTLAGIEGAGFETGDDSLAQISAVLAIIGNNQAGNSLTSGDLNNIEDRILGTSNTHTVTETYDLLEDLMGSSWASGSDTIHAISSRTTTINTGVTQLDTLVDTFLGGSNLS